MLDGQTVVDSRQAKIVRPENPPPRTYAFPPEDVDEAVPESARIEVDGHVAVQWDEMDHWYEEAEEVFVHPRDPNKRIDSLRSSRHVVIERDGQRLAESRRPVLLFEGGLPERYYLPHDDVDMSRLRPIKKTTQCPYKGEASYYAVRVGDEWIDGLAWVYHTPLREVEPIRGLVCFYNEKVETTVDGEPQETPSSPFG